MIIMLARKFLASAPVVASNGSSRRAVAAAAAAAVSGGAARRGGGLMAAAPAAALLPGGAVSAAPFHQQQQQQLRLGVRCFATEGYKRLYVGNLSWETSDEDLMEHFKQFADVQECVIPRDRQGRSKGFGFVDVADDAADAAISQTNDTEFQGRRLNVNVATPMEERPPRREREFGSDRGDRPPRPDAQPVREGCRRLYVGNLRFDCKAAQLADHLSSYGRVEDVVIPLDPEGRSRGFAFVELEAGAAEAALDSLDQSEFQGRTMFVRPAHSGSEGGGGGGGGYGRGGGGGRGRGGYGRGGGGRGGGGYRDRGDRGGGGGGEEW